MSLKTNENYVFNQQHIKNSIVDNFILNLSNLVLESERQKFILNAQKIKDEMNLIDQFTTPKSSPFRVKKIKNPTDPYKFSSYLLFTKIYSLNSKNNGIKVNLFKLSKIWKNVSTEIKSNLLVYVNELNELTSKEEQKMYLDENFDEILKYFENINYVDNYERNYSTYREIRKEMKLQNINDIAENLNNYWKLIKVNKDLYDNFFSKYEYLHPLFQNEGEGEDEGEEFTIE